MHINEKEISDDEASQVVAALREVIGAAVDRAVRADRRIDDAIVGLALMMELSLVLGDICCEDHLENRIDTATQALADATRSCYRAYKEIDAEPVKH